MIAPDANRGHFSKKRNRFLNAFASVENVTEDHEAVGTMLLQHVNGLAQFLDVFVNVGQDAEFHGRLPGTCRIACHLTFASFRLTASRSNDSEFARPLST